MTINMLLQDPPPAYNEIYMHPNVLMITSPAHSYESPPPDYETAIRLPPPELTIFSELNCRPSLDPIPEDSSVRIEILDSSNRRENGTANSVADGNIYSIVNRNYYSVHNATCCRIGRLHNVCGFILWAIFISILAVLLIYLRWTHPDRMSQGAFIVLICLLILVFIKHLPPLFREYRDSSSQDE